MAYKSPRGPSPYVQRRRRASRRPKDGELARDACSVLLVLLASDADVVELRLREIHQLAVSRTVEIEQTREESSEPPYHTAYRCLLCEMTLTSRPELCWERGDQRVAIGAKI